MKRMLIMAMLVCLTGLLPGFSSCTPGSDAEAPGSVVPTPRPDPEPPTPDPSPFGNRVRIIVGAQAFTATLSDGAATRAFTALLPMSVRMSEMGGNEKYYNLPVSLPVAASNPQTIRAGDLMLWGSNTLVLFYQTFTTSYSYTRLGRIDDPSLLAGALGGANVDVRFEMAQ